MRSLHSNLLVVGIGTAIIVIFSLLFYFDITKKVDAGDAEVVGTITFRKRVIQRKYSTQVVWEDVEQNAPVYNYDSIRTAEGSVAVVRIKDGTQFTVNENSLVTVALAKDAIDIEFNRGSISANRGDVGEGKVKTLNIKSGGTTVSVDKSDVKLARKGKGLDLTVNKGNAVVDAGGVKKTLNSYQKMIVSAGKGMQVQTQKYRLTAPAFDSYIVTNGPKKTVPFSWEPVADAAALFLEVAKDAGFKNKIVAIPVKGVTSSQRFPEGSFYWRLKGKDVKTGAFDFSDARRFTLIRDDAVSLISPADGERFAYYEKKPLIRFKWSDSRLASSYRVIIAKDPEMTNVEKSIEVPSTAITLDSIGKGVYYWKVAVISGLKQNTPISFSTVHRLTVATTNTLEAPVPVYPPDGKSMSLKILKSSGINFSWKKNPELRFSRISIAKDSGFRKVVYSGVLASDILRFEGDLPVGTYYWRVSGVKQKKDITPPSPVQSIKVVAISELALLAPEKDAVTAAIEGEGTPAVQFMWKRMDVRGPFRIRVARDKGISSIYREQKLSGFYTAMKDIDPGTYYWQVSLLNREGDELINSEVRKVTVRDQLSLPVLISPRNGGTVDMRGEDSLDLRWRRSEGADFYRIELYRLNGRRRYKIFSSTTRDNEYEMRTLNKLDESRFLLTLQAFDTEGGKIIRKSPEVKSVFDITLGGPMGKPVIDIPKVFYIE